MPLTRAPVALTNPLVLPDNTNAEGYSLNTKDNEGVGGVVNLSGGASGNGGSVNLSNGGGSINNNNDGGINLVATKVGIGTESPSGFTTINKSNSNYSLNNADAHLVLENDSDQSLFVFSFSETPLAGVRGDSSGNFNWHATGSQGHQFYNSIDNNTPVLGMSGSGLQIGGNAGDASASKLNVNGNVAIGYSVSESAPANGLIVSGQVGVGTNAPNASAALEVLSTTQGVRMPNMTTTQKNAISSPVAGLMVFDTTLAKLCVYSGSAWQTITSI